MGIVWPVDNEPGKLIGEETYTGMDGFEGIAALIGLFAIGAKVSALPAEAATCQFCPGQPDGQGHRRRAADPLHRGHRPFPGDQHPAGGSSPEPDDVSAELRVPFSRQEALAQPFLPAAAFQRGRRGGQSPCLHQRRLLDKLDEHQRAQRCRQPSGAREAAMAGVQTQRSGRQSNAAPNATTAGAFRWSGVEAIQVVS